jgi:signal peptidase I
MMTSNTIKLWKAITLFLVTLSLLFTKLAWLVVIVLSIITVLATGVYIKRKLPFRYLRVAFKYVTFLAVIFLTAVSLKVFLVDIFIIPSNSMEDFFAPGDLIIVNKLAYGPKLPQSPLEIPWVNLLYYVNDGATTRMRLSRWPYHRLGGYSEIRRGDVLVYELGDVFVTKRCIIQPGEIFAMKNGNVFINSVKYDDPATVRNNFLIQAADEHKFYQRFKESDYCCILRRDTQTRQLVGNFSYNVLEKIKRFPEVKSLNIYESKYSEGTRLFAYVPQLKWTLDNMGPITVPKRGMCITLTNQSLALYGNILKYFEQQAIYSEQGKFFCGGREIKSYTFKYNYYFMLGDNRKSSDDSRVNGFVCETQVIGKVQFHF